MNAKTKGMLTNKQRKLVEENLSVVGWVIYKDIRTDETKNGFSYEDIYQEGCYWLCKAAMTYDSTFTKFCTYAEKVIRNGLISYCRRECRKQNHEGSVSHEHLIFLIDQNMSHTDDFAGEINMREVMYLLNALKVEYTGITRLGIECLALKLSGIPIKQMALHYEVKASYISAWISRAKVKLRKNKGILRILASLEVGGL